MIFLRIASFIALFFSAVSMPWTITAGLTIISIAIFSWFCEAVVISFLLGSIYGFSGKDGGFLFAFFVLALAADLFTEEYFKKFIQGKNLISYALVIFSGGILTALFWLIFRIIIHYV